MCYPYVYGSYHFMVHCAGIVTTNFFVFPIKLSTYLTVFNIICYDGIDLAPMCQAQCDLHQIKLNILRRFLSPR